MTECASTDCQASATKSGFCERHYRQARRRGLIGWDGTVCSVEDCVRPAVSRGLCDPHYRQVLGAEQGACSIDGCEKPIFGREWCQTHYMRWSRHGDPLAWKKPKRQICSVADCEFLAKGNGLCDLHYRRMKRYGSTELPPKPVRVDPPPFTCKQCGVDLPKQRAGRKAFCSEGCKQAWQYWDRRQNQRVNQLKIYGLTVEQYETLVTEQDNRCGICGDSDPKTNGGEHWCVDHDHATGQVRGLLCQECNVGVGKFRDDPALLRAAIAYLTKG